ncbi:MAG: tetratricopeptide repeat protein [Proteobacteria bacterium]|nr:tetratricopeptide repeat protein [Pseudomonadota bacterium]
MARTIKKMNIKKTDQLQSTSWKIMEYVAENKSKFLVILGILVFFILSSSGWYLYRLNYEKNAHKMYSSAFSFNHKNELNTVKLYEELVKKYPNSDAATIALYSLGNIYFNLNEVDKSIDAYKEFIGKAKGKNDLTALAYIGLGYCYEVKKNFTEALKSFENSINYCIGGSYEGIIYRNMARIHEETNNPKKAVEYYKKALEQTTDPSMEVLIKRKISILG